MPTSKNLVEQYLNGLSAQDSRALNESLLNTFIFRPADVAEEAKHKARADQKQLAEILARTDAPWTIREVVLNAGRTLYYSSGPYHNYYTARLAELVTRAAKAIGKTADGDKFVAAMARYDEQFAESRAGAVFGGLLASSDEVIRLASAIIKVAIEKLGVDYFSKSERKALTGIATTELARTLGSK